ncbi:MAG: hypothetical protein ABI658_07290 [Acidimicrobiales bacterium]
MLVATPPRLRTRDQLDHNRRETAVVQPLGRFSASVVLGGLVVAPMVATARAPHLHARLLSSFGSSWRYWRAGQVWRLFTSAFVQSRHGFVTGIVVLISLLPLAEWRIGSPRAAIVFLAGDWISSVTAMLGARVLAAFGSDTASTVLAHVDSGASSALYACGGAFVWSLSPSRLRTLLVVILVGDLTTSAATNHTLADIQHPLATLVGAGVMQFSARRDRAEMLSHA